MSTKFKNNVDKLRDNLGHGNVTTQQTNDIIEEIIFNRLRGKKYFYGICLTGASPAESTPLPVKDGMIYPIKLRPLDLIDDIIEDPCHEKFKKDPKKVGVLISMCPIAIGYSQLGAGQRTPGFGERVLVEFTCGHPSESGKMRCLRYRYPSANEEYDYYCSNQALQSMVGKFTATSPMSMGTFAGGQGDRPMSEAAIPDMGPEMYLGRSKRRKPPTMIVVHTTAGWTKKGAIRTLMRKHLGYHYILDYDGSVDMLSDPAIWNTWHAPPTNMYSIGISFVNVAWERKGVKEKKIANNTEPWKEYQWLHPRTKRIDRKRKWQPFTNEQVNSYVTLMRQLVQKFNITRENVKMHAEVSKTGKMDPGPAFPWEQTLNQIYGG